MLFKCCCANNVCCQHVEKNPDPELSVQLAALRCFRGTAPIREHHSVH